MITVAAQPVLELAVEALSLDPDTKAGQLAAHIRETAPGADYQRSRRGWYVPLVDLIGWLPGVAELLYAQMADAGQVEISGGLDIRAPGCERLALPARTIFRLGAGLAEALLALDENHPGPSRVFTAPGAAWVLSLQNGEIRIQAFEQTCLAPAGELKEAALQALEEIQQFAGRIEPLLLAFHDQWITAEAVRAVLGL